ncbi:uncharacterized protein LOC116212199 [Punica granatum]|uniref:Uncharacterized protein LOC116212199 n=1 Tax=Punica granatum TaxID=22663 RepID=A0A6P8E7Y5_PUNGR|nr:uncharacterized protein LOC116212199 [Punica granatum]
MAINSSIEAKSKSEKDMLLPRKPVELSSSQTFRLAITLQKEWTKPSSPRPSNSTSSGYTKEVSRQVPANDKDDGDGGYGDSTDESHEDEGDNEDPIGVNKGIEAEDDDVFGLGQLLEQLNQFYVESDDDIQNEDNTCDLDGNIDEFLEEGIGDDFHNLRGSYDEREVDGAALREWCVRRNYDFKWQYNEGTRYTAICKHRSICKFRVYAVKLADESTFQIRTFIPEHTCGRENINHLVSALYLAKRYEDDFKENSKLDVHAFQARIQRELGCEVSLKKIYMAKAEAIKNVEGDHLEQYCIIRDYAAIILEKDRGSVVNVCVDPQPPTIVDGVPKELPPRFQRFFVSFNAMKYGLIHGCRPFIGLDGCHLKSYNGGHLLSAIAKDGNENIFPVAMAVVEQENRESWGLAQAFKEHFPRLDHRYCLKYLVDNFKKQWKGKQEVDIVWEAASATTVKGFEVTMKKMLQLEQKQVANGKCEEDSSAKKKSCIYPRTKIFKEVSSSRRR